MRTSTGRTNWIALALAGVSAVLAVTIVILRGLNWQYDAYRWLPSAAAYSWAIDALGAVAWCIPGLLIARRRPDVPFGWLALAAGLGHGLAGAGLEWAVWSELGGKDLPGASIGLWMAAWGAVVELPVLAVMYVRFPENRRADGWLGLVSSIAPVVVLAGVAVQALSPFSTIFGIRPDEPFGGLTNPLGLGVLDGFPGGEPFFAFGMLAACAVVVVRWRRATGEHRDVVRWLVAVALAAPLVVLAVLLLPPATGFAVAEAETFLEVATITAVLLRYRVYATERVLNRAWVYALLTASLAAAYAGIVAVGGRVLSEQGASLVGAVVVALAFAPVRARLQRLVNQVMYGDRDDPYAALARLGRRLDAALAPDAVLPTVVQTIAETLRLPYVAIAFQRHGALTVAAAIGKPVGSLERLPLRHRDQRMGELWLAPRTPGATFSPADRLLLTDLARQAGSAAHAAQLTTELQRSRTALVTAREEERRRLRRDLHDGLGPALASMTLQADAARDRYAVEPARGDALLADLTEQLHEATADIRRLVYDLRPPALDELGLVGALQAQASRHDIGCTHIDVQAPTALPLLPAAVEVAAYRIAREAVTNVLRHAQARRCTVTFASDDRTAVLTVEVRDDGRGLPAEPRVGVGLTSMRERAEELGGSCVVEARPAGGTRVYATLPYRSPAEGVTSTES
jgi:signal transduction histidine kinase